MDFSLNCAWLLDAYTWDANLPSGCRRKSHGTKLRNLILSGDLVPRDSAAVAIAREVKFRDMLNSTSTRHHHHSYKGYQHHHHRVPNPDVSSLAAPPPSSSNSGNRRTHIRSRSDATGLLLSPNGPGAVPGSLMTAPGGPASGSARKRLHLGDLTSGRAFDNGCACFESRVAAVNDLRGERTPCSCGAPRLAPQQEFIRALISIGKRLSSQSLPNKVQLTTSLPPQI